MKNEIFKLAILVAIVSAAMASCSSITPYRGNALDARIPSPIESRDVKEITLTFKVHDKATGRPYSDWTARILTYTIGQPEARQVFGAPRAAEGRDPRVSFNVNSKESLPHNAGWAVSIRRTGDKGPILDILDFLEQPTHSKTIIYELE